MTVTNAKGLEDKTETVKDGRELDTPLFMVVNKKTASAAEVSTLGD